MLEDNVIEKDRSKTVDTRIISPHNLREDLGQDRLRPLNFEEFIGQDELKENLRSLLKRLCSAMKLLIMFY